MKIAVNNVAKDTGKPLDKIRIWLRTAIVKKIYAWSLAVTH